MGPVRRLAIVLVAFAAVGGACAGGPADQPVPGSVTVGAFGFTESHILAELYAQAMEAKGIPVRRALDLASREVVEPALEQGAVDFVPEYSGTALEFLNRAAGQATADPAATYGLLRDAFALRGITTLEPAAAQNQNALAVTESTAQHFRLSRVSDLVPLAHDMVFGAPPECPERRFCLTGLIAVYGLSFREVRPLDAGGPLTIGALEGEEIDVGLVFTTSPAIVTSRLVVLADDRGLQPADNVVPVVRDSVLERHGNTLRDAVNAVSSMLTTDELVELNRTVDIDGRSPREAARLWLGRRGLGKA